MWRSVLPEQASAGVSAGVAVSGEAQPGCRCYVFLRQGSVFDPYSKISLVVFLLFEGSSDSWGDFLHQWVFHGSQGGGWCKFCRTCKDTFVHFWFIKLCAVLYINVLPVFNTGPHSPGGSAAALHVLSVSRCVEIPWRYSHLVSYCLFWFWSEAGELKLVFCFYICTINELKEKAGSC